MSKREARRLLAQTLDEAAAGYQRAHVIPHCAACARPCCWLDPLVLELNWPQLKALWQPGESRAAFDKRLAAGKGPPEIRAQDGLYFAHRKVCPAYDAAKRNCRIYDQKLKPVGCTDFPVYQDRGKIIADLRCEAVDLTALTRWLADAVGPGFRIRQQADADFPFLVTLSLQRTVGVDF